MTEKTDIVVIGGGIIGISTAMHIQKLHPDKKIVVLEKENSLASHQSGHNSGVVHAGVYYTPGTLKAKLCREGSEAIYAFCQTHGIRFEQCGKLIVATNSIEDGRLNNIFERAIKNGLSPQRFNQSELRAHEPRITGTSALLIPSSGITDYPAITRKMGEIFEENGGSISTGREVTSLKESSSEIAVETTKGPLVASYAIVCGGLMADRLARMCGLDIDFKTVPFRGEYYRLRNSKDNIVKHLIYPVPDPNLPFLGVHLTRMVGGYVTIGPNAVLALARQGYSWGKISVGDLLDYGLYPGLWKLLSKNVRSAYSELTSSVSKRKYLSLCQKYCPELTLDDMEPYRSGVRAQAITRDGRMVEDFLLKHSRRSLHVCNAPSPAATAAIPIGKHIAQEAKI